MFHDFESFITLELCIQPMLLQHILYLKFIDDIVSKIDVVSILKILSL